MFYSRWGSLRAERERERERVMALIYTVLGVDKGIFERFTV